MQRWCRWRSTFRWPLNVSGCLCHCRLRNSCIERHWRPSPIACPLEKGWKAPIWSGVLSCMWPLKGCGWNVLVIGCLSRKVGLSSLLISLAPLEKRETKESFALWLFIYSQWKDAGESVRTWLWKWTNNQGLQTNLECTGTEWDLSCSIVYLAACIFFVCFKSQKGCPGIGSTVCLDDLGKQVDVTPRCSTSRRSDWTCVLTFTLSGLRHQFSVLGFRRLEWFFSY